MNKLFDISVETHEGEKAEYTFFQSVNLFISPDVVTARYRNDGATRKSSGNGRTNLSDESNARQV
jgi:hypothetical protein